MPVLEVFVRVRGRAGADGGAETGTDWRSGAADQYSGTAAPHVLLGWFSQPAGETLPAAPHIRTETETRT
jgi:hypothetical protein